MRNVEQFTQTLADSREQIDQIFADAGAMTARLNETSIKVEQTLDTANKAIEAIDADRINATITNVESFSKMLADNNGPMSLQVIANTATLTDNLNQTTTRIDSAVEQVSALLDAVDREDLTTTLANVREFSTTLADNARPSTASCVMPHVSPARSIPSKSIASWEMPSAFARRARARAARIPTASSAMLRH